MTPITDTPITDDALLRAVAAAEQRVAEDREALERAEERVRGTERELVLLSELARLRGLPLSTSADGAEAGTAANGSLAAADLPRVSYGTTSRLSPRRDALVRAVIDVLSENGKPMQIRALMAELVSRDAPIPGRGEQANLISVIAKAPEITRPERGVYGLKAWEATATAASAKRQRRRRATR